MSRFGPPKEPCPYCGAEMECDIVDVGVGSVQCGPYHCERCGASEIGPEGEEEWFQATDEEKQTGFYRSRHSPYANTIDGKLIDHKTAKEAYKAGLLDKKPPRDRNKNINDRE